MADNEFWPALETVADTVELPPDINSGETAVARSESAGEVSPMVHSFCFSTEEVLLLKEAVLAFREAEVQRVKQFSKMLNGEIEVPAPFRKADVIKAELICEENKMRLASFLTKLKAEPYEKAV